MSECKYHCSATATSCIIRDEMLIVFMLHESTRRFESAFPHLPMFVSSYSLHPDCFINSFILLSSTSTSRTVSSGERREWDNGKEICGQYWWNFTAVSLESSCLRTCEKYLCWASYDFFYIMRAFYLHTRCIQSCMFYWCWCMIISYDLGYFEDGERRGRRPEHFPFSPPSKEIKWKEGRRKEGEKRTL